VSTLTEHAIRIRELADEGLSPPSWGRFDDANELTYAIVMLPNGRARTWSREAREPCDVFAGRIVRDVIECVRGTCVGVLVA
jgi:hypothetical protein